MVKLLHIASFNGNIGDNASHFGFEKILNHIGLNFKIERLEIRRAYKNYKGEDKVTFDEGFVKYANGFDFVVIGGGGFLDYWVPGSANGTTFDISNDILNKIKSKLLFTSIGSNPHKEVPKENYNKFESFIKFALDKDNITLALRNDGSHDSLKNDFPSIQHDRISMIADHGFFYDIVNDTQPIINEDYFCINITNDQIAMFNEGRQLEDKEWYYSELTRVVEHFVNEYDYKLVLVPHIYSDIQAISEFIDYLPQHIIRNKMIISSYMQGDTGTEYTFNVYKNSKLNIGSRYHCNVCSLKFGVPTIGLSPLKRIEFIHEQLTDEESSFYIEKGFSDKIIDMDFKKSVVNIDKLEELKKSTLDFYRNYFS
ncbi:polysaccharide pyruvyl transferase family protein [Vibrio splendidus]|uniref:polysaccharide pyruvyl transferase family protein n=1 Tax=Vibrio splendidus TaxID=29497 RepID=UPI000769DA27|nr:polysaccharide pyruvyl transferase family protein [Vibrio splendidus]CAH6817388.1 PS_pyruv_trans domain-containing protein [Vibrio chagasii]